MRYSYEFKRKCVELYRQGQWPETPEGIKDPENFRDMVRRWVRLEESNGVQFPAFTILTKEATGQMSIIHERMPIMFRRDMISDWL